MIGSLRGIVGAVGEDAAIIDVSGVGYLVQASGRTLARLETGAPAKLFIETHVREDAIRLFGFSSEEERAWFAHVQTIPGVGAKVALAILDVLTVTELADAIALQDKAQVARATGVGPKLAQRIVAELATKSGPKTFLPAGATAATPRTAPVAAAGGGARQEAVSALVNLGIDQSSAARAVATAAKQIDESSSAPELIRAALKEVSR
jgi:Holliday junction DNA helicase RuvA